MARIRLRTKFLLSMLLISSGLTCTSLLLVRHTVQKQVRNEIFVDLRNSVDTFQSFQSQRGHTHAFRRIVGGSPELACVDDDTARGHNSGCLDRFVAVGGK